MPARWPPSAGSSGWAESIRSKLAGARGGGERHNVSPSLRNLFRYSGSRQWNYVFPTIGNPSVGELEAREILDLLTAIWLAKAETARRVRQRLEAVFKSAILRGYRQQVSPVSA